MLFLQLPSRRLYKFRRCQQVTTGCRFVVFGLRREDPIALRFRFYYDFVSTDRKRYQLLKTAYFGSSSGLTVTLNRDLLAVENDTEENVRYSTNSVGVVVYNINVHVALIFFFSPRRGNNLGIPWTPLFES